MYSAFERKYSVENEDVCASNVGLTLTCEAPTLYVVRDAYGEDNTIAWIFAHLSAIAMYVGVKKGDAVVVQQLMSMSRVILHNFEGMRVTDMMLFFSHFKAGHYGEFYGSFDPMVITRSINKFVEWSRQKRGEVVRQQRQAEDRRRREMVDEVLMGYSEYLASVNG